jgi:hypothetical protein
MFRYIMRDSVGLPESSIILAIDPQSSDTLYAGTGKGVFKTTNGATSWNPVNSGLPDFLDEPYTPVSALVSDPLKPGMLYAAIANLSTGKVFQSTNGGEGWVEADDGLPEAYVGTLVTDPQDSLTIYAGTNLGVFKSMDGGMSWTAANSGLTAIFDAGRGY